MNEVKARQAIEDVLARFDFKPVHEYMQRVGWMYFDSVSTPSIETLKEAARTVLQAVIESKDSKHGAASTGGFTGRLDQWKRGGRFYLDLQFIPFHTEVYF